jgi:hypothetical protein
MSGTVQHAEHTSVDRGHRRTADDIFFSAMALLALLIVLVGFAQSYFLAGMVRAKLPNVLVHVHGALFVAWIVLLVAQTGLVVVRRVRWHMALGLLAVVTAPLMVVVGIWTTLDSIHRNNGAGPPPEILLLGNTSSILIFAILIGWGMLARYNAVAHKRLMILGTLSILGPAIDRWHLGLPVTLAIILLLPLLVVAYDLWSRRKVQRATMVATCLIYASIFTLLPLSHLPFWQRCISWIRR